LKREIFEVVYSLKKTLLGVFIEIIVLKNLLKIVMHASYETL